MESTPWYRKTEMIIGLSALLVSLVAVCVGVYSAYLDRAFARASVWPKVEISTIYSSTQKKFLYQVKNVGTGPALVKYTKVKFNSKFVNNWNELAHLVGQQDLSFSTYHIGDRVLPALATINPMVTENTALAEAFNNNKSAIEIEICFCSVFDQCWSTKTGVAKDIVSDCKVDTDEIFLD
jgi:hypothetical protein